jgi:hypothetical protein
MKSNKIRIVAEIGASSTAMLGVICLIFAFFPIINPSHYNVISLNVYDGVYRYISGALASGAFFWISFRLNKIAESIRKK